MGRQVFDIKEFKYGIISAVDAEDLPSESASDSLNVDGDAGEGKLQGILTDLTYQIPTTTNVPDITRGALIENGGYYDLIYHDANTDTINAICDFYDTNANVTTKKLTLASSLVSDKVTIIQNNKEVHIGIDTQEGKWIGHCSHRQFSKGTISGDNIRWAISDASNTSPIIVEAVGHSLRNGDVVRIEGVAGNTAANGFWIVGAVDHFAGTFSLIGSTGNGAYSAGTDYAYQHLCIESIECKRDIGTSAGEVSLTIGAENTATGYFTSGILYSWKISLIYDGIQETFLGGNYTDTASVNADYYPLTIVVDSAYPTVANPDGLGQFNRRITGINVYRADSSDGTVAHLGLHRKVAEIDINDSNWSASTNDYALTLNDYGTYYTVGGTTYNIDPVTFTQNSGLPETLFNTVIYYSLSARGNGYLFAGDVSQLPLVGQARRYILKSQYLKYDTFNYIEDILVMPEPITALHFYDGKLWAFSLNKTYRINPDGLYIEDVFDDAGCQGQRAVHSNEYGMFFGSFQSAWMYRDGVFSRISDAIKQSTTSGKSWASFYKTTLTDLIVTSHSKKGYILFINERNFSGAKLFAWAYHPARKRWDAFGFADYASSANAGVFKGRNGEVYLSNGTATYQLMASTGYQAWEWFSQELPSDKVRQKKSFTMIKVDTTGTVAINYGVDGATPATAYTNESLINAYNKSIKIKLNASSGSNSVDSLELVYRDLVGAR